MAEKLDLLLEAERRGILPAQLKPVLAEARRRGLVPGGAAAPAPQPGPAQPMLPALPANGPLRSPLDDPLLGPAFREGGARAAAGAQPPAPMDPDGALAFTRAFARRLGDNILATPELLADAILPRLMPRPGGSGPLDLISQGISGVTGGAVDPTAAAERVRERVRGGGHVIDLPSTTDIAAGIETAVQAVPQALSGLAAAAERVRGPLPAALASLRPEGPIPGGPGPAVSAPQPGLGEQFRAAQEQEMVTDIQMAEGAPFATGAGNVAGDIATLAGGRLALKGATAAQRAAPIIAQRAQTTLGRAYQTVARSLLSTGGRALETGAEGAFLASLQGVDPLVVGGFAAGGQAAGDVIARPVIEKIKKMGFTKAVVAAAVLSFAVKEIVPGGFQIIEETVKQRAGEIGIATLLAGGAVIFTGRFGKEFSTSPALNELVGVLPRGLALSLLKDRLEDPASEAVSAKFAEDPDFFGPKAKRLLTRAHTVEDVGLKATIDRLMEERDFRLKFQALTAPPAQ